MSGEDGHLGAGKSPSRRTFLGWMGSALGLIVAGSLPTFAAGPRLRFDLEPHFVAVELSVTELPPGTSGRALFPNGFTTRLEGRIGDGDTDLVLPLPGIAPDYAIRGSLSETEAVLRVDRGILSNRLVRIETDESGAQFEILKADRSWRPGRCTNRGHVVVGDQGLHVTIQPVRPRRVQFAQLEILRDGPKIAGAMQVEPVRGPILDVARLEGRVERL